MKKKIFTLLLVTLLNNQTQAQIAEIGIKGGVNYANFKTDSFDTSAITSYHFGPTLNLKLFKRVALQGEILYSTVGGKYKKPVDEIVKEYKNELGYLAIPLSLQIGLSDNIYVEAGSQFSFLLSNKNEFDINNENTFDLGFFGGIGFRLFKHVNIGARYIGGSKNVYKTNEFKNNVGQAFIEIKF